jgi:hypothetical protein
MQRAIPAAQKAVARHTGSVRATVSVGVNGMGWVGGVSDAGGVPDAGIPTEGQNRRTKIVPELKLANLFWKRARVLQLQLSETIVALAIKQWDKDITRSAHARSAPVTLARSRAEQAPALASSEATRPSKAYRIGLDTRKTRAAQSLVVPGKPTAGTGCTGTSPHSTAAALRLGRTIDCRISAVSLSEGEAARKSSVYAMQEIVAPSANQQPGDFWWKPTGLWPGGKERWHRNA